MRALIWTPNYAPELTGIPPLVTDAAEWLAARGHAVDVVAPMPNYPQRRVYEGYRHRAFVTERRNGVAIHRSWLRVRPEERFLDKALYEVTTATLSLPNIVKRLGRSDVLLCVVPTVLAATYATLLPRRPRTVLWVQDLVLQAAAAVSMPDVARRAVAAVERLELRAVRRADRVIVCSPGFEEYFVARGVDDSKIDLIYNWADVARVVAAQPPSVNGNARFLYAGNLGYTQGLETLVEASQLRGGFDVNIVGDGNAARVVKELAARLANVTVRPPVTREEFPNLLAAHDVHLVIQRRAAAGANLPSKIASYLASGRPIVASLEENTPAAQLLRDSGGAIIVEPESPSALADAMEHLRSDPALRSELGRNGRAFAEAHLDKGAAMARLEEVLDG